MVVYNAATQLNSVVYVAVDALRMPKQRGGVRGQLYTTNLPVDGVCIFRRGGAELTLSKVVSACHAASQWQSALQALVETVLQLLRRCVLEPACKVRQ